VPLPGSLGAASEVLPLAATPFLKTTAAPLRDRLRGETGTLWRKRDRGDLAFESRPTIVVCMKAI